ncbi:MAG: MFS transporter [bacterium]|nr:MFS transporter [bacterium]
MRIFSLTGLFKNQPPSVLTLFWVELWSAFARHGLRSLFVLYITSELLFKDSEAYFLYGTFGSLMFLTPLLGGILADRYLGAAHVVVLGCLTMLAGVLCLLSEPLFYPALAFIIIGYGFIKTNVSSLLGQMYPAEQKQERETGYGYMYVFTNIGALSAPIACGFFGETYGWNYGFLIMAFALVLSTGLFLKAFSLFHDLAYKFQWSKSLSIYALLLVMAAGIAVFLEQGGQWMNYYGFFLFLILVGPISYIAFKCSGTERTAIFQIMLVFSVSMLVTALGEQSGSSINLFVNRLIDRDIAQDTRFQPVGLWS